MFCSGGQDEPAMDACCFGCFVRCLGGAGGWKGGEKNEISSNDKTVVFVLVPTVEIFVCEQEMRKFRLRCHCSGGLKLSRNCTGTNLGSEGGFRQSYQTFF